MSNEHDRPDVRRLWQGQAVEDTSMSLDELRGALAKLNRVERRRTWACGLVCLMFVAALGGLLLQAAPIPAVRAAEGFFAIAAGFFLYQAIRGLRRAPGKLLIQGEPENGAAFYKSILERQRKFYRGSALWVPVLVSACLLPGIVLMPQFRIMLIALWVLLVPFWVYTSLVMAREARRELDKLDASFG
jgi:hypothetical protein